MATSRRAALLTLVPVVVALLAGCTGGAADRPATTPASPSASTTPPDASTRFGGAPLGGVTGPCKVHTPASWTAALGGARLWASRTSSHVSGVPMPDAAGVLSEDDTTTRATITVRSADGARPVASIPRPGGVGSMGDAVADANHVAFVFSTGGAEQAASSWRLYLWDRSATPAAVVARNPVGPGGAPLPGGYVHPVLTDGALWWIQAARSRAGDAVHAAGSALMRYDLTTRRTSVVHRGLVTSLVAYRGQILTTAVGTDLTPGPSGNPPLRVRAFDATTGRETAPPPGLTAGPDQPDWMVTNGDVVAWNTTDGALRGWRRQWGRTITLVPVLANWPLAARNRPPLDYPGYPRLLGPLLAFNSTATFVLDLRSNSFVQLTDHHGGLEASGTRLAMWQYVRDEPPAEGAGLTTTQWVLDTARLSPLPRCPLR